MRAVVAWAGGATLESILTETAVAPGDFVRNIRQIIDLVRQWARWLLIPIRGRRPRRPWPC